MTEMEPVEALVDVQRIVLAFSLLLISIFAAIAGIGRCRPLWRAFDCRATACFRDRRADGLGSGAREYLRSSLSVRGSV